MEQQDIRTLQILEEIENGHMPSQRDLAKKLNVSLGLINSFIKRLARKGYFKITNIPKNRVKYIMTPKGAAEKTRLTYEYIQVSYHFYKEARQKLRMIFDAFTSEGVKRVAFYGANDFSEIAYISLQETSIELVAVIDDSKKGKQFLNKTVCQSSNLPSLSFDKILVTESFPNDELYSRLEEQNVNRDQIVMLA